MIKHLTLSMGLLAGCAQDDVAWQPLDTATPDLASLHRQRIVGGTAHLGNPETALLLPLDANGAVIGLCSSTLVAPNVLLTAAHCVDDRIGAAGFAAYFGTDATVETDPGFQLAVAAEAVAIHPGWNPDQVATGNDIAVVRLVQNVPIAPRRVRTEPLAAADKGQPVELVGWGITIGGNEDFGVKRRVVSALTDFDAKLIAAGGATSNTCQGDSGGPAFLGGRVVGVTSFGDAGCVQTGFYTRVDAFLDFLGPAGIDVTPDATDPGEDPPPPDEECGKVFGCDQNPSGEDNADDGGGCSTGRGNGLAALLVVFGLISAGRKRRRGAR